MFGFIEKIVLKRLFKRIAEQLPVAQDRLTELWEEHSEEILEKALEALKAAITKVLKKALENS